MGGRGDRPDDCRKHQAAHQLRDAQEERASEDEPVEGVPGAILRGHETAGGKEEKGDILDAHGAREEGARVQEKDGEGKMRKNEKLYKVRGFFTDKYGLGDDFFNSIGGRIMIYSELEFKDGKRTLVFIDNEKLILGFDDGKEHSLTKIKTSSICDNEVPF